MATLAPLIALTLGLYIAVGVLFTVAFQMRGLRRVDPAAAEGSLAFRLLITPGCVALWPLLAASWRRGGPPGEHNSHRDHAAAARPS